MYDALDAPWSRLVLSSSIRQQHGVIQIHAKTTSLQEVEEGHQAGRRLRFHGQAAHGRRDQGLCRGPEEVSAGTGPDLRSADELGGGASGAGTPVPDAVQANWKAI